MPKFSICIPNYNYQRYIGKTIQSVLDQRNQDFEIVIADNASTDDSVKVINTFACSDSRVRYKVNNCNVGFAGNLLRTSEMAQGDWMTMLSSDDLLDPQILDDYSQIIDFFGEEAANVILSSSQQVIDSEGNPLNIINIDWKLWNGAKKMEKLSEKLQANVWVISAQELLRQSILLMRTPFAFASTTYSRKLFQEVEGYIQGGIINPDKKFAWSILGKAQKAVFIEKTLVKYRVHNQNQGSQQAKSGALKHLTDEYIASFKMEPALLERANITERQLQYGFIQHDVLLRGFVELSRGNVLLVKRMLWFGKGAYPHILKSSPKYYVLYILSRLGKLGSWLANQGYKFYFEKWEKKTIRNSK